MRLPTRTHAILDYALGVLLIALPFLLGFGGGAQTVVPVAVGVALIACSLATDYELGVVRRVQMVPHLWLDAIAGLFLAVSPWMFGFDTEVWLPHLILGLLSLVVAVTTDTIPAYERRRAG